MGKIGYAPEWGDEHTKAYEEFERRKTEPGFLSPRFKKIDDALEWLNNA